MLRSWARCTVCMCTSVYIQTCVAASRPKLLLTGRSCSNVCACTCTQVPHAAPSQLHLPRLWSKREHKKHSPPAAHMLGASGPWHLDDRLLRSLFELWSECPGQTCDGCSVLGMHQSASSVQNSNVDSDSCPCLKHVFATHVEHVANQHLNWKPSLPSCWS